MMGLAVLPARLRDELAAVEKGLLEGRDLTEDPATAPHAEWAAGIAAEHPELNAENAGEILQQEVGKVFAAVLEDAGVFKRTENGRAAFGRFIDCLAVRGI